MILCLGTTPTMQRTMIFDRVIPNEPNRAREVIEYASGKSINAARVAKTLGEQTATTGFAGGDRGKALRQGITGDGIEDLLVECQAQTRLCTTVIDRAAQTATELIEEALPVEPKAWSDLNHALHTHSPRAKVIICCGSLARGGSPDLYAQVAAQKKPNQHVIIDGRGDLVTNALKHPGFILKLNQEELFATLGIPLEGPAPSGPSRNELSSFLQSAMRHACPHEGAIIVTLGKSGAVALHASAFFRVTVPTLKAVSAIGSGDSFAAGLAVALARGQSFPDALRLAAACGCANALTPRAGDVRLEDVHSISSQITIQNL